MSVKNWRALAEKCAAQLALEPLRLDLQARVKLFEARARRAESEGDL
jgi:hypothetical protein